MKLKKIEAKKAPNNTKESIGSYLLKIYKDDLKAGFIYTCYRKYDRKIFIGYIKSLEILQELEIKNSYSIIDKRLGSYRESLILKKSRREIGPYKQSIDGSYNYSESLVKHLNTLGWPVGNLYKLNKINKYL